MKFRFLGRIGRSNSRSTSKIDAISAVKPVRPLVAPNTSHDLSEPVDAMPERVQPPTQDSLVELTHVQAVKPYPYGNVVHGGYTIGDETTILRAAWAMLGAMSQGIPDNQQPLKLDFLHRMVGIMRLPPNLQHALDQAYLQGRSGQVTLKVLGAKLISWVGQNSSLLDLIGELMVYITLAGETLNAPRLEQLVQSLKVLNINKVRVLHLIKLRQMELHLGELYHETPGAYVAFNLEKLTNLERAPQLVCEYIQGILGLDEKFTMLQAVAATQALVLHYVPEHLANQHVPRPMINLCLKKLTEAITAYKLIRNNPARFQIIS